jgi:prepilin-type N-terminal cleavage/methylation domain-containing protein
MQRTPKRAGFTLIELVIALVIISILATIAVPVFWRAKGRGFEASMRADLRSVAVLQEGYYEKHRAYAADPSDLAALTLSPGVQLTVTYAQADGWAGMTTHPSLPVRRCGIRMGAAPADPDNPAAGTGMVECGDH